MDSQANISYKTSPAYVKIIPGDNSKHVEIWVYESPNGGKRMQTEL